MEVDRISNLGDDVLVHILSFLESSTSVSTALLSRRWSDLWKRTSKLKFTNSKVLWSDDSQNKSLLSFVSRVNHVLKSHRAPFLKEFTVEFYAIKSNRHDVARWLEFAFSRRVETLNLNFRGRSEYPSALLLEEVLLDPTLIPIGIQSLRVLRLKQTKINTPDAIHFFLRSCPVLERLVIEDASIMTLGCLEIISSSLKDLDLRPRTRKISVKVSAPNLTRLKINHNTSRVFLQNVPSLVHLIFGCSPVSKMLDFASVASQLETLTLYRDSLEAASFLVPKMLKLKKLVVEDCYYDIQPDRIVPFRVAGFLRAAPCLEDFDVKITKLALRNCPIPIFQHSSLKRFRLLWSCGGTACDDHRVGGLSRCGDRVRLVRYVVENCVGLEVIDISRCEGKEAWRDNCPAFDCCVRLATNEEREAFEKTMQMQLPGHIKLRIVNHYHKSPSHYLHVHDRSPLIFNFL